MLDVYIGALIVIAIIIGYINEDKFIRLEHRLWLVIKRTLLQLRHTTNTRSGGEV